MNLKFKDVKKMLAGVVCGMVLVTTGCSKEESITFNETIEENKENTLFDEVGIDEALINADTLERYINLEKKLDKLNVVTKDEYFTEEVEKYNGISLDELEELVNDFSENKVEFLEKKDIQDIKIMLGYKQKEITSYIDTNTYDIVTNAVMAATKDALANDMNLDAKNIILPEEEDRESVNYSDKIFYVDDRGVKYKLNVSGFKDSDMIATSIKVIHQYQGEDRSELPDRDSAVEALDIAKELIGKDVSVTQKKVK